MDPVQTLTPEQASSKTTLAPPQPLFSWSAPGATREHQARRFLMVLLPSIPLVAFSIDFLYAYITQASADLAEDRPIDATHPFLGALLLALVLSLLCIFIYHGVLKILAEHQ
jgi:succinate dehydrogenase hydrophobic anchor subunit